ncbi:MAG: DUF2142 domain-containing protein [Bradyrhizobiaceae bacterium]|nr:DUF2142 domain-containing protein [Bradyrhizobiaceae bacterium]
MRLLCNPAAAFLLISIPFGAATLAINPPLRGYDETSHFLRAYGISKGDVVPSTFDEKGRRGILIPDRLNEELSVFEEARQYVFTPGFDYRPAFDKYRRLLAERRTQGSSEVFALYQGSEAYSPVPYLPQIVVAWLGRIFNADFLTLFTLMRVVGFVVMTSVVTYAIAIVPHLQWSFFAIAMLPSAFYGRTLVGADGAALSFSLAVMALSLRRACNPLPDAPWSRAVFMTLCVLSKPPQVVWTLLEAMAPPAKGISRDWTKVMLITLPGIVLTGLWIAAVSGDVGAWRVSAGTNTPPEMFGAKQQLVLLLSHPLRFPSMLLATLGHWEIVQLWRQLIGTLGWLDTGLQGWTYPTLSALLVATCISPLPLDAAVRRRLAAACAVTALAYVLCVYLIFYLVWTPTNVEVIWGVQGRYLVVVLAPLAVVAAATINRGPSATIRATLAVATATLSAVATIEALLRVNW